MENELTKTDAIRKADISRIGTEIADGLRNGTIDPFIIKRNIYAVEKIAEAIKPALTEVIRAAADKYPQAEKTILLHGAEFSRTEVGTTYDYNGCGDPVWMRLKAEFDAAKEALDKRQKFLQSIDGHETITDENTGEIVTVFPPVKKSTSSVSCSIK